MVAPELLDLFWRWDGSRQRLRAHTLDKEAISPLIALRNDFHHGRVPDSRVSDRVRDGLAWLHHLLDALQFLADYELSFIRRIVVEQRETAYIHDFTLFTGCLSEPQRRTLAMQMEPGALIVLHKQQGRHLRLEPFMVYGDHLKGPDIYLLNNMAHNRAGYASAQFPGEELRTNDNTWPEGRIYHEMLREFVEALPGVESAPPEIETDPEAPYPFEDASTRSTAEVFRQQYAVRTPVIQHSSPYKFLDYYNPEDQDIFFGREREIRVLEQKFYASRLLVLHGESGSGKTSLIRAGLIPRLDPEAYIPVYVRMLHEPLQEITRELLRQLGIEKAPVVEPSESPGTALLDLLFRLTAQVSKTVVIVLDQFEEFFLRFPEELRTRFQTELADCVHVPRLDVKFLLALRSDYFAGLAAFEDAIPTMFTHQLHLQRLSESQALDAVLKPAARLDIQVDEAMVQIKLLPELLSEDGGIEPPLLQIVCDALYQNAKSEGRQEISMADYEAIGDVNACLGQYLDSKLRQFGRHQPVARAVLKTLVTAAGTKRASFADEILSRLQNLSPSSQSSDSKSPPGRGQEGNPPDGKNSPPGRGQGWGLSEQELKHNYLDKFARDRLLRVEEVEGRARYELSHDYLAAHIEAWIADSERELTKILELIDRAYETYRASNVLLERSALQMIKPYAEQLVLPEAKQTFLRRSHTQVQKQRRGMLLNVAAALMFVALVVGGVFGYQTYQQYQETLRQRDLALVKQQEAEEQHQRAEQEKERAEQERNNALRTQSLFLADLARQENEKHNHTEAILLALEALPASMQDPDKPYVPEAEVQLYRGVTNLRERAVLSGHASEVIYAVFSPDDTCIVTMSFDRTVRVWDVTTGQQTATLSSHKSWLTSAAFSSNGTRVVTASGEDPVRVWDVTTGQELATLSGHESSVYFATFSPDGTRIATVSTERRIGTFAYPQPGSPIVTTSNDQPPARVQVWDVTTGQELTTLKDQEGGVAFGAFSPDGTRIVTVSYYYLKGVISLRTVRVWDADTGREVSTLSGHEGGVESAVFSPDGTRIVTASSDQTARVWDAVTGQEMVTLSGHEGFVKSASFSPDGTRIVTASSDKTARVWDAATGQEMVRLSGHEGWVYSASFSPDGTRIVTASHDDHTARVWDVTTGEEVATLRGHAGGVISAAFSLDSTRIVTASLDQTARVWNTTTAPGVVTLSGHEGGVDSVDFSPDGTHIVTASSDKTARVWDAATGQEMVRLNGHTQRMSAVAFSPDGTRIVTASYDGTVPRVWDAATGREMGRLSGHKDSVQSASFSPDGTRIVTASSDKTARVWDVATAQETFRLSGHKDSVQSASFSPDGTRIVTASWDQTARVWDASTGQEMATLSGHKYGVMSAEFSPDGTRIVTTSADKARIWDVATGEEVATLRGRAGDVKSAAFSPDGTRIVTVCSSSTTQVWDAATGQAVGTLSGHNSWLTSAAFSPDGTRIVITSEDETVRIWPAFPSTQVLIDHARALAPRQLTCEQRRQYFLSEEACPSVP